MLVQYFCKTMEQGKKEWIIKYWVGGMGSANSISAVMQFRLVKWPAEEQSERTPGDALEKVGPWTLLMLRIPIPA